MLHLLSSDSIISLMRSSPKTCAIFFFTLVPPKPGPNGCYLAIPVTPTPVPNGFCRGNPLLLLSWSSPSSSSSITQLSVLLEFCLAALARTSFLLLTFPSPSTSGRSRSNGSLFPRVARENDALVNVVVGRLGPGSPRKNALELVVAEPLALEGCKKA